MTTANTHLIPPITTVIVAIIVAAGVLGATFLATQEMSNFRSLKAQQLRNEGIDSCAHNSKYVYTETIDNLVKTTEEPSQNSYAECLKLKNIK